ncbi:A24 family peptidase [Albidovulum sp.]|uniref:A24 family peptidase n=1 Tax=Albidovulum sp. TaxID=1872424 RepID=UPI001DB16FF8|nr:prepilin peptidase [Paracoccaceae bacterium]MCC0047128.1 prepilin peptidase [Defluviimonas sp.]HPE24880.1 prepilin peptidase [Albidovulum sp.]MCB2118401.1 prepilin peptidase [Paracoccaceae bacterium]MCB2121373.1 prepilin peptidase [Paracoccaceae bacterium]
MSSAELLPYVPLVAVAPVMLAAGWFDLRFLRIPNVLSLMVVAAFVLFCLAYPPGDLVWRLAVAAGVFALGFVAYYFRAFGAGDVKFLSALMLLVPLESLALFANVFSLSMLAGIAVVLTMKRIPVFARTGWASMRPGRHFPMGVSIGLAGLLHPIAVVALGAG